MSALPEAPSIAIAKLEKAERRARRGYVEARAVHLEAQAAHLRKPNDATLAAVDVADRERRGARIAWNDAYDALELAQTGGRS